jgi:ATP-dependent Clp protease, proteolytic subunit ClpP|nr:MAG TPA: Putative ATP dependent Clp protease [Caudoviricetes sp.]
MAFKIKGVIGVDIDGDDFAERLSRVSGDVEFEINSPGGSVFHGIRIFNAIKKYDRGKRRMHVVGDCSSMAAYIMLAGDGDVEFEPNSIVVLHNPWSFAIGDYRAMQKEAEILSGMAELYAQEFVKKGLFAKNEIRQIMDAETWFMGEKLKKLGKVLVDNEEQSQQDDEPAEIKIAALRMRIEEAKARIKTLKIDDEAGKIAALIKENKTFGFNNPVGQTVQNGSGSEIPHRAKTEGEIEMVTTLEELKAQNASVYNEAKAEGQKEEQKRVASLMQFIDIDKQAVINAINNGVNVNDNEFQASILMARTNKQQIAEMEGGNPSAVAPQQENHAPENQEQQTEEEKAKIQKEAEDRKLQGILAAMGIEYNS